MPLTPNPLPVKTYTRFALKNGNKYYRELDLDYGRYSTGWSTYVGEAKGFADMAAAEAMLKQQRKYCVEGTITIVELTTVTTEKEISVHEDPESSEDE